MLLLPVYPAAASTLTEDSCRDETAAQEMNAPRVTRTKNNHSSGPPHNIISVSRPKCPNRVPPHSAPSRDHDCLAERQFPLVGAPNLNPESPFCTRFFRSGQQPGLLSMRLSQLWPVLGPKPQSLHNPAPLARSLNHGLPPSISICFISE